jgi:radical SAM protein with 4Fe4S-binding SPASM domain
MQSGMSEDELKHDLFLTLVPAWACNLRCSFCYQTSFSREIFLSDEVLYQKLGEIYPRCAALTLLGGEITLLKNMKNYVRFLDEKHPHIAIKIITNGVLFDGEWTNIALRNASKLVFSINAATPGTYARMLGVSQKSRIFGKVLANIEAYLQARASSRIPQPRPVLSMVVNKENVCDLDAFADLCQRFDCDAIFLFDCSKTGELNPKDIEIIQKVLLVRRSFYPLMNVYHFNIPSAFMEEPCNLAFLGDFTDVSEIPGNLIEDSLPEYKAQSLLGARMWDAYIFNSIGDQEIKCLAPWKNVVVLPDGQVLPCSFLSGYRLGNIRDNDFAQILESEKSLSIRRTIDDGSYSLCNQYCPSPGFKNRRK